ncbi:MAG TPA: hypothetical protein VKU79_07140, partial [Thermoplasmataceae archaeon]|nr:hypothetical protein [Thermoplasmataceae archaeon]
EGAFIINKTTGAQVGESMNLMQFQVKNGALQPVVVYPTNVSTGSPVYPAPDVVLTSIASGNPFTSTDQTASAYYNHNYY